MEILKKNIAEMALRANVPNATSSTTPAVDDSKLRFMLVGTHIQQVTGYSKVTYNLVKEISKMDDVKLIHFGFQRNSGPIAGTRKYPENVTEIDAAALETPAPPGQPPNQGFGFAALPAKIREHKPHVVMIYNDFAVINNFLDAINKSGVERNFKIWIYADQVYTLQQKPYLDAINRESDRVFVFSEYWRDILKEQGIIRPIEIINHGFAASDFPVVPRAIARKVINIPEDIFLFISLNRNQPRKRLDLLIIAFAELITKYPQKPICLMMVCDKGEKGGWNLFEIFARELKKRNAPIEMFGSRLMITSKDMNFRDDEINMLYNAADVGVSCAEGEGWGLCSFEMMGVGKPQVVSDVGGHKEFCNKDNSQVIKVSSRQYLPMCYCSLNGEAHLVDPHDFCLGMEAYLLDSELLEKHGKAAREKVCEYTWEKVTGALRKRLTKTWRDIKEGDE